MARIGLRPGRLDDAVEMFGLSVDRVELERHVAGVADIMLDARRNDDGAAIPDRDLLVTEVDRPLAFLEAEELVDPVVGFGTDLVARAVLAP